MTTRCYRKGSFKSARNVNHPRLVVMDDCGHELLCGLDRYGNWQLPNQEWNAVVLKMLAERILAWHSTVLVSINLPQVDFKTIRANLSDLKGIVSRIVVIGDPFLGQDGEYDIRIGTVGATIYVLSRDFFEAAEANHLTPWGLAFRKYAEADVRSLEPEQFDTYFTGVGLNGVFAEVLLVRATDPAVLATRGRRFTTTAYDTRKWSAE